MKKELESFLLAWVNSIQAAVFVLVFAQTYCARFLLLSEKCSLFTSLGGEDNLCPNNEQFRWAQHFLLAF